MGLIWGVVLIIFSTVCWGGQLVSLFAPDKAVRWGLMEADDDVDPAFGADGRAEAKWDTLSLWTMIVAGVLLMFDQSAWPYFGLVGGGMYAYFAGRGIFARTALRHGGIRIGNAQNIRIGFVALGLWGLMAFITIIAAVAALESR